MVSNSYSALGVDNVSVMVNSKELKHGTRASFLSCMGQTRCRKRQYNLDQDLVAAFSLNLVDK